MRAALDDDSKRKRYRTNAINIQITSTSWCLELISNTVILSWYFVATDNRDTNTALIWIDTILCFVVVPASYIANTEVAKAYFLASGWYMLLIDRFRSNKINPVSLEEIEMKPDCKAVPPICIAPKPIPSTFGNIKALSNKKCNLKY